MYAGDAPTLPLLVDQGAADSFLADGQLQPENLSSAVDGKENLPLTLRMQDGYDHSYHFIATFVDDHVKHAAEALS